MALVPLVIKILAQSLSHSFFPFCFESSESFELPQFTSKFLLTNKTHIFSRTKHTSTSVVTAHNHMHSITNHKKSIEQNFAFAFNTHQTTLTLLLLWVRVVVGGRLRRTFRFCFCNSLKQRTISAVCCVCCVCLASEPRLPVCVCVCVCMSRVRVRKRGLFGLRLGLVRLHMYTALHHVQCVCLCCLCCLSWLASKKRVCLP